MVEDNAHTYWERSDAFDMALDLTAGQRGLAKLGEVMTRWIKHMLAIDVEIEPVTEMRDVSFNWYLGLDAVGTQIGDTLWNGSSLDPRGQASVVGLYQLKFKDPTVVAEKIGVGACVPDPGDDTRQGAPYETPESFDRPADMASGTGQLR